jgi:hypothetical protein
MYTYNTKGEILEGYEPMKDSFFFGENSSENCGSTISSEGDSIKMPMLWTAVGVGGLIIILGLVLAYYYYNRKKVESTVSSIGSSISSVAVSPSVSPASFGMGTDNPANAGMEWGFKFY